MKYSYRAKNLNGEETQGEMDAQDRFDLAKILRSRGYTVISYKEEKNKKRFSFSLPEFGTVPIAEKMIFSNNLSVMLSSGVPIVRALTILSRQTQNKKFSRILKQLAEKIEQGVSLSESMKDHPSTFSALFTAMVKVGEESGNLSQSMLLIAEQLERDNSLKKKIKGAMMYPAIIIIAMIVIGILMLIYVVPTLVSTFSELGVELPASTKFIIGLSNFLTGRPFLSAAIFLLVIAGVNWFARTTSGKKALNFMLLKIPIFAPLVKKINSARTSRTLASLFASGVDIVEALSITKEVLQNPNYKQVLEDAKADIQKGNPLSDSFKKAGHLYPLLLGEMMAVGEETGKLSDMLLRLAVFYEGEVADTTKNMTTIIEPILMLLIGAVVGFFAISMIKPMYSMMSGI